MWVNVCLPNKLYFEEISKTRLMWKNVIKLPKKIIQQVSDFFVRKLCDLLWLICRRSLVTLLLPNTHLCFLLENEICFGSWPRLLGLPAQSLIETPIPSTSLRKLPSPLDPTRAGLTARSREDETRNARRNANRNPWWLKFMSPFKWAVQKETWDDHREISVCIPMTISSPVFSGTGCTIPWQINTLDCKLKTLKKTRCIEVDKSLNFPLKKPGFLFTIFPNQEPGGRGPPLKNQNHPENGSILEVVLQGGSSSSRFLIREYSK